MAPKKPKQTVRRPPRTTEELRTNLLKGMDDLVSGKITVKEADAQIKEARQLLRQAKQRLDR